jgi:hypothetical protein
LGGGFHAAGIRRELARGDAHQRRLSGAVFAHEGEHFAGGDVERHVVDRAAAVDLCTERLRDARQAHVRIRPALSAARF